MKFAICLLMASGLGAVCSARPHSDQWPVREQTTIQKTLELSAPPMRLVVDNVEGYVHVTGTDGSAVRIIAHETIRAETSSDLQQAKSEVKLDIDSKPGSVSVYYDAPWRCNNGCCNGCNDHRRFYSVTYDIDVQVPHGARTVLSTVNGGDIRVDGTADFDVSNVNGGIAMNGISGAGDAHTVNGPITIHFAKNPSSPCDFKSINGEMDAYFPGELSADLAFKTFNGQIYSDFDVQPRAVQTSQTERQGGKFKFVYRSNGVRGGRTGKGGPEMTFDAFNGNIRLHREQ